MFRNIGRKIKTLAMVYTWIGIIASLIAAIVIGDDSLGIIIFVLGALISWVSSFLLYGFGQLVENSEKLVWAHGMPSTARVEPPMALTAHMQALDNWRAQGLISEQEYIEKRSHLLGGRDI